jgi:hypothetical protein
MAQSIEAKLNEAIERYKQQAETVLRLHKELTNAKIVSAFYERQHKMLKAGLPNESKDHLNKCFERSTDNAGLREAINNEKRRYTK